MPNAFPDFRILIKTNVSSITYEISKSKQEEAVSMHWLTQHLLTLTNFTTWCLSWESINVPQMTSC